MKENTELSPEQQTLLNAPAYKIAFQDPDLLERDELRPVRLLLELQKPVLSLQEQNIESTIVVFGSARTLPPDVAEARLTRAQEDLAADPNDPKLNQAVRVAVKRLEQSAYYKTARDFARLVSTRCQLDERCNHVVITGGGPGIMEAGNRGAHDVGAKSIGLNIDLPFEQAPNGYITPELCFNFHYFAIRKMHFLMLAQALVAFPGGFGTLDELFESLTLIQTQTVEPIPVVLVGRHFWERILNFDALVDEGVISPKDLDLFHFAETPEEIWGFIHNEDPEEPKIEIK
ncbi:LOG family protein [Kiritimatiellaeota bacterium B1221]|nr:LOG family protein [Kiritimatiellaeota bacterium B1221]